MSSTKASSGLVLNMPPSKFIAACLLYCGSLFILQGAVSFAVFHSFQLDRSAAGALLTFSLGLIFFVDGFGRWRDPEQDDGEYGLYEYVGAAFAVLLTFLTLGQLLAI